MALACDGVDVCHGWKLLTIIPLVAGLAHSKVAIAKTERKSSEVLAFKRHTHALQLASAVANVPAMSSTTFTRYVQAA